MSARHRRRSLWRRAAIVGVAWTAGSLDVTFADDAATIPATDGAAVTATPPTGSTGETTTPAPSEPPASRTTIPEGGGPEGWENAEVFGRTPEVVVQAPTLTPRPIFETTTGVSAITRDALEREVPRSASDVFFGRPGLWNTQGSAGHMGTPVIRGLTGNQVLYVFDGVRLTDDRTPPGPGGYWELADMEIVDHMEVLRSPDSVLYGTQAIGGVTAFYTAFPSDFTTCGTCVGGRLRLTGAVGGEEFGRIRAQGHFATPRFRAVGGGTFVWAGDLEGGGDVGVLSPTRYGAESGDLRMEWRATPHSILGLSFFASGKDWPDNFIFPNRRQYNRREREIGILRWRELCPTRLWDESELRLAFVHFGQTTDRRDRVQLDETDVLSPQVDAIFHKALGGGRHRLTYGVHAHRDEVDLLTTRPTSTTRQIPEGYFQNLGAYAQDEWDVSYHLRLTAGARFDVAQAHTDPDAATTDPLVDPEDVRIDKTDTAWTGKLGVLYRVNDCLSFTGNLSRGYRFPSLENLVGVVQHPDEVSIGNPDVSPEYSTNLEVGVHVRTARFHASAIAFRSWYDDLIVATYGTFKGLTYIDRNGNGTEDPDESVFLTANAGTARTHGVEIDADYLVRPGLTAFGNFTWWRGEFRPDVTEPLGIPTNGTLGLRWEPSPRFWLEGSAHMVRKFTQIPAPFYFAEQFFYADPQDESKGPIRQDVRVPGYTTFDLRGGVRFGPHAELTLGVENLFDKEYRAYASRHQGPGTTLVATFTATF